MTEEFVGTWHLCPAGFYFEELCPDSGFLLTKFLSCMRHAEQNCKMWWRLWWDVVRLPLHIAPGDPAGSSDRQKPKQLKGCLRWLGGVKMSQVSTVPLTWECLDYWHAHTDTLLFFAVEWIKETRRICKFLARRPQWAGLPTNVESWVGVHHTLGVMCLIASLSFNESQYRSTCYMIAWNQKQHFMVCL